MTKTEWPEYAYVAKQDDGRWLVFVQNKEGRTRSLIYKDVIMAQHQCKHWRAELGVSKLVQTHWNVNV